jgi:TolA-binding protein
MKRKWLFVLVSLGVIINACFLPVSFSQEPTKEDETLFVAKKAFEDGFYDVSQGLLERFLKSFPNTDKKAEVELLIGRCYFQQNKYLDALAAFDRLSSQPYAKNIRDAVCYWIAEVHFKGNSFDKAAEFYKKITEGFPKSTYLASAYYSLGWCQFQQQDYKEALENFQAVEEKFPKEPNAKDAALKIIECLYNLKDYQGLKDKAKAYLKEYAKDVPKQGYLNFYLAEANYYLNDFEEALVAYQKAIASSVDQRMQGLSRLGLGWTYLKLQKYTEAENALSEIKEDALEKPSRDALFLARAVLMSETNRLGEATKIYDELVGKTEDPVVLVQAYIGKADAIYNQADYPAAIKVYKEALDKTEKPDMPAELVDKIHYSLAWAYLKSGEFREAIREFQKIVKQSTDKIIKVSALCQIGDTYQDSGEFDKAKETYDTILKDYPDTSYSDYVQYQLGLTQLKSGNYDGAAIAFVALQRNYPQTKLLDDATYALGLAYFQRQDYNSSKEAFDKFRVEFADSNLKPQSMYLLGTSFFNLGKYTEAIEVFKEIVRLYSNDRDLTQKAEYEIADCYYQMGDEQEAMNRFKALRSKYPDSTLTAEIMWWLGEYYYRRNDLELARRYFSSLIQDFPKSSLIADSYYALGSSYAEESKLEDAVTNFKKVIELGRSDLAGQAATAIADIYVKQEKPDSALDAYNGILKQYPHLESLIYPKMGELFFKVSQYDRSLEYYKKSLDIVPVKDMPAIQLKIAEVIEAQGNQDKAVEEYLKVTYLYSENTALATKALLRVAQIYEQKEDYKEASTIYKRIVAMNVEEAKYAQERIDWINSHSK